MQLKCPAKVILSGEHSVVYGHTAICTAVNLYANVNVKYGSGSHIQYNIPQWNLNNKRIHLDIQDQSTDSNTYYMNRITQIMKPYIPKNQSLELDIHTNIPGSSGLGSSASVAVCLAIAAKSNDILNTAKQIENIFHGKQGSGLDVEVCYRGGIQQFTKQNGCSALNWNIHKLLLIDSGIRKPKGTEGTIDKVRQQLNSGSKIVDQIGDVTQQILQHGLQLELVHRNHQLLDQLGLCTPEQNDIVNICMRNGIPCKMTGAGDGGYCVAILNKQDNMANLISQLRYQYIEADVEYNGIQNDNDDNFSIFVQRLFQATSSKQLIQVLLDNGFDQWEQTKELTMPILNSLKIPNKACLLILGILKELNEPQQFEKQIEQKYENILTVDLMMKGFNKKKDYTKKPPIKSKTETLSGASVLSLNGMGLTGLGDCIKCAQNIQILHLYDNKLECITLRDFNYLRILNIQNNLLKQVEIEQLPNLEKAYFDRNSLSQMPALPHKLTTISISQQNTGEFLFNEESLELAQYSLQSITCEQSNVEFAQCLGVLANLEYLNLKNNKIKEFDDIEDSLISLQNIKEIDLRGNPITQIYKYRDRVVLLCKTIDSIDGKSVLQHERQFLINLGKQKIIKRNQSLDVPKAKQPKPEVFGIKEKIMINNQQVSNGLNSGKHFHDSKITQLTKHR